MCLENFVLFVLTLDLIENILFQFLYMGMESWTLVFIYAMSKQSYKIFLPEGVESTKINRNVYTSKDENAEQNRITTSFGETYLFSCDHIYFSKS